MMTMVILSMAVAIGGLLGGMVWKREVPVSISALAMDSGWLWTPWLWAVTFLLAPPLMTVLAGAWKAVGLAMLTCLLLTGAMPLFDAEHSKWHYVCAVAAGVLSQVCVAVINPWWLMTWAAAPILKIIDSNTKVLKNKWVLILETLCATTMYGALI